LPDSLSQTGCERWYIISQGPATGYASHFVSSLKSSTIATLSAIPYATKNMIVPAITGPGRVRWTTR
jgi:hypothetical protein